MLSGLWLRCGDGMTVLSDVGGLGSVDWVSGVYWD